MTFILIDFESRSKLSLRDCGSTQYSSHPSTSPMFLGYSSYERALRGDVLIWDPATPFPRELAHMAGLPHVTFVAHNTQFDRTMWRIHFTEKLGVPLPLKWICTATRASANGLPRGLDEACHALGLPGKDKDGQKALRKLYAPDKKTGRFLMPADAPELYAAARRYCQIDIQRMAQLMQATMPISPDDQRYFELDQRMNERGFALDADRVDALLEVLELAYTDVEARALHLPSLTSTKELHAFLGAHGVSLPNLQAQTIKDALAMDLPDAVREVLSLRQLAGLASPKKLLAFRQRGMEEVIDGRRFYVLRDTYVVNGAHTGRHTSKGAQAQNLKRDCATEAEIELLLTKDLELVKTLAGEPLPLLGLSVRPCVTARRGKLLIGDFSKIETCVTFWLAGEERGRRMLAEGKDLYCDLAGSIFGRVITKKDADERQLGKQGVLGCGFGIGAVKFLETCHKYGIKIPPEMAAKTVQTYRSVYSAVPRYWYKLGDAVAAAIRGTPQQLGPLRIAANAKQLVIQLPSGRKLRYQQPTINAAGEIGYWQGGENTHQWEKQYTWGGKLTENVVQAIANDLQREASHRLEDAGFDIVMSSHDEIVAEGDETRLDEFLFIMSMKDSLPSWAEGIPVTVEGKATKRYRK